MYDSVVIARNVHLTSDLFAKSIYVTRNGEVSIVFNQDSPVTSIPELTVDYLDTLCSRFYYGGYSHKHAIADILLLNGLLSSRYYPDFYDALRNNLVEQRVTIISYGLLQ